MTRKPRPRRPRRRPVPQPKSWLELTPQERDQLLRNAAKTIGAFGTKLAADLDSTLRHIQFPNVHVTYETLDVIGTTPAHGKPSLGKLTMTEHRRQIGHSRGAVK